MSNATITFDDFTSSKRRQQRLTYVAISIGVIFALYLSITFFVFSEKSEFLPGTIAKIVKLEGNVMIKRGADTLEYEPGFLVLGGDNFQSIGESEVEIEYLDDGTKIYLGNDTTLLMNASDGGKKTNLAGGTARFIVGRQSTGQPMTLTSYNSDAVVVENGTFIQKYNGLETFFEVQSGQLQVRRFSDGRITDVFAGQTHTCKPDDGGIIQFNPDGLE